jgi:hypothetical protein
MGTELFFNESSFRPNEVREGMKTVAKGAKEAVPQCGICQRQKRPGVLTRAVRGTGIPSAVRVRFLTETSNAKRSKQAVRRLSLRRAYFTFREAEYFTSDRRSDISH